MDIPQLATILSSTFDPNLREEAEKKLNEVSVRVTFVPLRAYSIISRDIIRKQKARISLKILCSASQVLRYESKLMDLNRAIVKSLFDCALEQELYTWSKKTDLLENDMGLIGMNPKITSTNIHAKFFNFFFSQIHKVPGFLTLLLQVVMSNDVQIPVRQSGR